MALKRLTTAEMVSVTQTWVEPGHADRKALETVPPIAAIWPNIETAHAALLATQIDMEAVRVASIASEQREIDATHDAFARAIWHAVEAHKFLAMRDAAAFAALDNLQATLFPDALRVVQYSYRETAGQASLLASRLTAEHEALLASIPLRQGTLLDAVRAWMDAALRLGVLENERTRHIPEPTAPGTVTRARAQWIRTVHTVRNLIALVGTQDPVIQRILMRIAAVEAMAARRARGQVPSEPVPDEPGPGQGSGDGDVALPG